MTNSSAVPASENPMGRNAIIVHGMSFVAAVAMFAGVRAVGRNSPDLVAVVGVGLAAILVMLIWSAVLAIRALYRGEASLWPCVVLTLYMIELALLTITLELFLASGIPILIPFFVAGTFIAAPLAKWWTGKRERKDVARGEIWTRRTRWRAGLWRYLVLMMVLTIVALPGPLYVYSVHTAIRDYGPWMLNKSSIPGWRGVVVSLTPTFIRDLAADLVSDRTKQHLLASGGLSREYLIQHIDDRNYDSALLGLAKVSPAEAVRIAERSLRRTNLTGNEWYEAYVVAQYGDASTIQETFDALPMNSWIRMRLLRYVRKDSGLLPFLKRTACDASMCYDALVHIKEIEPLLLAPLIEEFLKSPDLKLRSSAAMGIDLIPQKEVRQELLLDCVKNNDVYVACDVARRQLYDSLDWLPVLLEAAAERNGVRTRRIVTDVVDSNYPEFQLERLSTPKPDATVIETPEEIAEWEKNRERLLQKLERHWAWQEKRAR